MADYKATASGNWSTMTWSPAGTPGIGDSVWANGFTVTLDQDIDLGSGTISNTANGGIGAVAGGTFTFGTTRVITANIQAGTAACLGATAGAVFTINGNITGGTSAAGHGFDITATATGTITGNITGVSGYGIYSTINAGNTINVIGNCIANPVSAILSLSGNLNIVGNITGGGATNTHGVDFRGTNNLTVTGNVIGGAGTSAYGLVSYSTGTVTINGNSIGGSTLTSYGILTQSTGQVTVNGYAIASSACAGASGVAVGVYPPIIIQGAIAHSSGTSAIHGRIAFKSSNPFIEVLSENLVDMVTLTDGTQTDGLLPAEEDVREGVQYNLGGNEGTLAVPPKASVLNGVPTDDGVGEFTGSDPSALAEAILQEMQISPEPIAERLRNSVTQEILGDMLDAALP